MAKNETAYAGEDMSSYDETINWDEVGVPPGIGDYNFIVEKGEYKPTAAGKHMVKVEAKIEAAVDPNQETFIGRVVFTNFNFFQSGAFNVKAFCKALDIPLPSQVNKAILEDWIQENLIGVVFGASVEHRDWQGQPMADLKKFCTPFEIGGAAIDTSGGSLDEDTAAVQEEPGEEPEVEAAGEEEPESEDVEEGVIEDEPTPPPPAPTRSLRAAAPAPAAKPAAKANGHANGHTNGKTNGKQLALPTPAAKPAAKSVKGKKDAPQARR